MLLNRDKSLLLIVDLQAGLLPVIDGGEQAVNEAIWIGGVAEALEIPVWVTEQNPKGLGGSEPRLLEGLGEHQLWTKCHFDAHHEREFAQALEATGRRQIVLCGSEAHICVLQTGLGLLAAGYDVYLLADASVSRRAGEAALAGRRIERAGGCIVSADMVAYEWLKRCDSPTFKEVHREFLRPRASRTLRFYN